jgi:hypothetical protein
VHVSPLGDAVQLPPGALDSTTVVGFVGTCAAVGGCPSMLVTVTTSVVEVAERDERAADEPVRGRLSDRVAVPGAGDAVGIGVGTGPVGGGPELPPPHAARKMSDAMATARVFMCRRLREAGYWFA